MYKVLLKPEYNTSKDSLVSRKILYYFAIFTIFNKKLIKTKQTKNRRMIIYGIIRRSFNIY